MAISTHTVTINPQNLSTWSRVDIINQLEDAFTWLGWHGDEVSGLAVGIASFTGGGDLNDDRENYYEDVNPISTSGIGTGASFYVSRYNTVKAVTVNNPGMNYQPGDTVTLSAEDIGGSANGAQDITARIVIAGSVTGGQGYGVTFSGLYDALGNDRNGAVVGQNQTITIREGDTLTIDNYQSSSSYSINIIPSGNFTKSSRLAYMSSGIDDEYYAGRVFNVINNGNSSNNGSQTIWTPLPGQRGVYYIVDDYSDYSSYTPTIVVEPAPSGINTVSVGSTTGFYVKDISDTSEPWGILKHKIQPNKKYGHTYRFFGLNGTNSRILFASGSGFFPFNYSSSDFNSYRYKTGHGGNYRFTGATGIDLSRYDIFSLGDSVSSISPVSMDNFENYFCPNDSYEVLTGGYTGYQLDLNLFRSSIDPNFVVFSYKNPTLSASKLKDRTFGTFILHNFESTIWDYDNLFLSGYTEILPAYDDRYPSLTFRTYVVGASDSTNYPSKRSAEFGYSTPVEGNVNSTRFVDFVVRSNTVGETTFSEPRIYYRNSNFSRYNQNHLTFSRSTLNSDSDFNAVIKGIPLNGMLIPVPYYMPDEFVLIDFNYDLPGVSIQQGDTITISGSEQYKVIMGSYAQDGTTRGILFCARSV